VRGTATPRLGAYAALAAAALFGALALRRPELAALAVPFALWLAVGLASAATPRYSAAVALERDRATEGEQVQLRLELRAATRVERLEVPLAAALPAGLAPPAGQPRVLVLALAAGERRTLRLPLGCRRWGAWRLGELRLRAEDRFGLFVWEQPADVAAEASLLRVYPRPETLRALIRPARTRQQAGDQVARRVGDGVEFGDLRPLLPGDHVRRINWRATARRGEPYVNQHHPERNAEVVLLLDTFTEAGDQRGSTLDLTVRAAASLAGHYLTRKDRVGVIGFGGVLRWLQPASGLGQVYHIVDALLATEVVPSYAEKTVATIPRRLLPAGALILGITPLIDQRGIRALLDLRGRGYEVAVLALSPTPFTRPTPDELGELAWRLWRLQREATRARYTRLGVPVAEWDGICPIEAALEEVRTFQRMARRGHA
jgi:uncharacterized protein (DUF58 family)